MKFYFECTDYPVKFRKISKIKSFERKTTKITISLATTFPLSVFKEATSCLAVLSSISNLEQLSHSKYL